MKYESSKIVNVKFGKNVKIIKPCNIYGSKLGDNVFIGPFVEIQKNTKIGNGSRIQSHTFICELVDIGKNCFIGHGVVLLMINLIKKWTLRTLNYGKSVC